MREGKVVRLARWGIAILILAFVVRTVVRNWHDFQTQTITWTFRPLPALASILLVWAMYLLLIEAWRRILAGWGESLAPVPAARIWVLSSLGKYVPGKVWAIAGMALMAKDRGVAAWAATASALLMQALSIGTGAAIAAMFGGQALATQRPELIAWFWVGGAGALVAVAALMYPPVSRRLLTMAGLGLDQPAPEPAPLVFGLIANLAAWIGYGGALWLLAEAVLVRSELAPAAAIAGFAASYIAGLVALFVPGGLVVREGLLFALLQGSIGAGPATALAVASRVLLTITELGAAVPFLILRWGSARAA